MTKKLKPNRVYITQYCKPIDVMAVSTTSAKRIATEDHTWEVIDADIRAEKQIPDNEWERQNGLS